MLRIVCLLAVLLLLFGCTDQGTSPSNEPADQPPDRREPPASYAESDQIALSVDAGLCAANLEFALNSFREIVAGEPEDKNVFYSPLSLTIALAMAYNGAKGQTAEVMAEAMGIEAMTLEEANQEFSDLTLCLQNCDSALVLNIANSMWVDEVYPIAATFRNNLVYYYFADVFRMLLNSQAAVDSINGWVELHTNGKITEMVDLNLVQNAVLMLIDALYFNAQWTFRFEEDSTKDKPFYPPGGETLTVQMMENSGRDFTYHYDSNFKAVRMPYGRNIAAMYVFLPEYDSNVGDFIAALNSDEWTEWMGSFDSLETYWGEYAEEHWDNIHARLRLHRYYRNHRA